MPGYNPLREMITKEAQKHVLKISDKPALLVNGRRRGADLLRQIFDEACERRRTWTPDTLAALGTPGQWLRTNGRGGTTDSHQAVHWCGIFATFVLRRAGIPVKWRDAVGIVPSDRDSTYVHKKLSWIPSHGYDKNDISPGDVCAIPRANHHFVIIEAPAGSAILRCVAGNGSYQQIEWQDHKRDEVNCHYKLVWDPFASRT